MIKKLLVFVALSCSLIGFNSIAEEVSKKDPYVMIQKVAEITFNRFAKEQEEIRKNPDLLKVIVKEELLPYINYGYAAYKVIGRNFSKTTKEERAAFVPAFRDYLITSYAQVFTLYNNQKVEFEPPRDFSGQKIVAVNTMITEPGRDVINIAFKVRFDSRTNEWKAFDMVAEGISLLDSKQAELSTIIRQKGLPYVTELLKEKSARHITFDKKKAK